MDPKKQGDPPKVVTETFKCPKIPWTDNTVLDKDFNDQ